MQWRVLKEYPSYRISEFGDVYSTHKSGKMLSPKEDKDGYLEVCLTENKTPNYVRVHRLVGMAFLDNDQNLPIINHKDLNVKNNHYTNLEWCTNSYNLKHYYENTAKRKVLSSYSNEDLIAMVTAYRNGMSQKDVAALFGLEARPDVITELVTGRRFSEITGITKDCDFKQRTTAKVTDEDILVILHKIHQDKIPQSVLCSEYGLSPAQLSRIANGTRRRVVYEQFMTTFNKGDCN